MICSYLEHLRKKFNMADVQEMKMETKSMSKSSPGKQGIDEKADTTLHETHNSENGMNGKKYQS